VNILGCDGLSVGYPGRLLCAALALRLEPGQCWAVLGNNGSGKSTLLRTLAGLQAPLDGKIRLDGVELPRLSARLRAGRIGILLQEESAAFWGDVLDYVLMGRYPHRHGLFGWTPADMGLARGAIERVDLSARLHQPLSTLSGGERQRARVALVLAQDPAILLLDEPLQHLDLRHQIEIISLLQRLAAEQGKTICMVLHDPLVARRFCDHALLLFDDTASLAGSARTLLQRDILERLYRCPLPTGGWSEQGSQARHV
jgi:iron complex transport system ATP-binding protein